MYARYESRQITFLMSRELTFGHPSVEHDAELAVTRAVVAIRTKRQFNETLMERFRAKQRTADCRYNCTDKASLR
jgi:hypothetical protein